jgi:hypothetical protein
MDILIFRVSFQQEKTEKVTGEHFTTQGMKKMLPLLFDY